MIEEKEIINDCVTKVFGDTVRPAFMGYVQTLKGDGNIQSGNLTITKTPIKDQGKYEKIGQEVGALVDEKNKAYGGSFSKCAQFLKILYPNGIKPDQYIDVLCMVRIFDKQMRIANKKDAFGESPYKDITGYGILGLENDNHSQIMTQRKGATNYDQDIK